MYKTEVAIVQETKWLKQQIQDLLRKGCQDAIQNDDIDLLKKKELEEMKDN